MLSPIRKSFQAFFDVERINFVARATGLIKRQREITASSFFTLLTLWKSDTIAYADLTTELELTFGEQVSNQAFAEKMKQADKFFQTIVAGAINDAKVLRNMKHIELPGVRNIFIADSTTLTLHRALAESYPGTGGNGPIAAMKLNTTFNLSSQTVAHIAMVEGTASEHSFQQAHRVLLNEGDLIIRDLGYYDAEDLKELQASKIYFLSRIPLSVRNFYSIDGKLFDLWQHLAQLKRFNFELVLQVGDHGVVARVIAVRLPKHAWKERIAKIEAEKGRKLTRVERAQAKWNLLITNLTEDLASRQTLISLYKCRWQIELIFKAWKSGLSIKCVTQIRDQAVIRAYVWARLANAVFMASIRAIVQREQAEEIGIQRWYRRVTSHLPRLRELVAERKWLQIAKIITNTIVPQCLPEKRSQKASLEKLNDCLDLDLKFTCGSTP